MKIISDNRLIIKSWCNQPEQSAIEQASNLANLPFAYHHIALMPDTHQGYGMPIGAVLATENVIVPNAVGVDIGCGMVACKTKYTYLAKEQIKQIIDNIRKMVPVGLSHRNTPLDIPTPPENANICKQQYDRARHQLGTLGGGNHFIEIQKGSDGHIWFMVHSGSRNLGKQVCDHYNDIAKRLNSQYFSSVDPKIDLAFLPLDSEFGQNYIVEMNYCNEFARLNRKQMAMDIVQAMFQVVKQEVIDITVFDKELINVGHNYARLEHHFGKNVWVHRKGATSAKLGEIGIIPGSQGTKSYIVEGLGNKDSFMSCSHGAGRKMGRKQAQQNLSLEQEIKLMDDKGIVHGIRNIKDLDEVSGAYKDIDIVMQEQQDLVKIKVELLPLGVLKG